MEKPPSIRLMGSLGSVVGLTVGVMVGLGVLVGLGVEVRVGCGVSVGGRVAVAVGVGCGKNSHAERTMENTIIKTGKHCFFFMVHLLAKFVKKPRRQVGAVWFG